MEIYQIAVLEHYVLRHRPKQSRLTFRDFPQLQTHFSPIFNHSQKLRVRGSQKRRTA